MELEPAFIDGAEFFDVERVEVLKGSASMLFGKGSTGGIVLNKPAVAMAATSTGMPYVTTRWMGGTLTNFETIKKSLAKFKKFNQMDANGEQSLGIVLLEMLTQCIPCIAVLVYVNIIIHRTQVDCMRECQRVHEELRRLAREFDGEDPPLEPKSEPVAEPEADDGVRAALPHARIHKR